MIAQAEVGILEMRDRDWDVCMIAVRESQGQVKLRGGGAGALVGAGMETVEMVLADMGSGGCVRGVLYVPIVEEIESGMKRSGA